MEDTFEGNPVRWQDYWAMMVRRRWWLMGPLFLCGFVAFGVAHIWPVECHPADAVPADTENLGEPAS